MMPRRLAIVFSALAIASSVRHRRKAAGFWQKQGQWSIGAVEADFPEALQDHLEFRGEFRDFKLYHSKASENMQADQPSPSAWVVEYDNLELMDQESERATALGLDVVLRRGGSVLIEGDVPATLGYDACGGNAEKTVVPVADYQVIPATMPESDLNKYLELAKTRNARNIAIRDHISKESIQGFIQHLQDYGSRNSYTGEGGTLDQAADWAADQLRKSGFTVTRDDFQPGGGWFSRRITPQIVAELEGNENPEKVVVVGAHLDSINQAFFGGDTAPGADDNGSGSAVLLEFARIIGMSGTKFKNTLRLVLFTGEEQGLLGSRAIARRWKNEGVDIICMLNADMMGYKLKDEPVTFALVSRNSNAELLNVVRTATETYMASQLTIGTSTVCCSDQQSFNSNGFPAVAIFETPTSRVVYPEYHKATDMIQAIDMDQMVTLGSGFMASAIMFAEIAE